MTAIERIPTSIVLASTSPSRRNLLTTAGLTFTVSNPEIDETVLKHDLIASTSYPRNVAPSLAAAKALAVSRIKSSSLAIGADQTLLFNDKMFDKPRTMDEARDHLLTLRAHTHHLHTAVACAVDGHILWAFDTTAELTMCNFSEPELDSYLAAVGDDCLTTVGGYKIEGPAITLFEAIEGDYFAILGLPLLPLLGFLRQAGLLPGSAP